MARRSFRSGFVGAVAVLTVAATAMALPALPSSAASIEPVAQHSRSGAAPGSGPVTLTGPVRPLRSALVGDCKRLSAVAGQLGETFEGQRLWRTVVSPACAIFMPGAVARRPVWDWPWQGGGIAADLPPDPAGEFGAWMIRCGSAGERRRCAILTEIVARPESGKGRPKLLVVHFVLDTIARQESLLWRVMVRRGRSVLRPARLVTLTGVSLQIDDGRERERFETCTRAGCLMEAGPGVSAKAARRLAEGEKLEIRLPRLGSRGEAYRASLPAEGFALGLQELQRLKQAERAGGPWR